VSHGLARISLIPDSLDQVSDYHVAMIYLWHLLAWVLRLITSDVTLTTAEDRLLEKPLDLASVSPAFGP
jgi:hypothetical protein